MDKQQAAAAGNAVMAPHLADQQAMREAIEQRRHSIRSYARGKRQRGAWLVIGAALAAAFALWVGSAMAPALAAGAGLGLAVGLWRTRGDA